MRRVVGQTSLPIHQLFAHQIIRQACCLKRSSETCGSDAPSYLSGRSVEYGNCVSTSMASCISHCERFGSAPHLYRAPSLSWAAIESQIVFDTAFSDENDWQLVRLLNWEIVPVTADVTGEIKFGLIHIRRTSFLVRFPKDEYESNDAFSTQFDLTHGPEILIEGCCQESQAAACLWNLSKSQCMLFPLYAPCSLNRSFRFRVFFSSRQNTMAQIHSPGWALVMWRMIFFFISESSKVEYQHKDEPAANARILVNELIGRCYDTSINTNIRAMTDADSQHQWVEKAKGISERTVEKITLI